MGVEWWMFDLPPISGQLRAVFYAGLLLLCILDRPSPLHAALIIGRTERTFYTPVPFMRALGISWVRPTFLWIVTALTVVVWIAAITGLCQPFAAVLTFLGFAFLHAVNAGALGSNHSTHLALYVLFALCFCVSNDAWSFDHYLSSHTRWPFPLTAAPIFESGFAPKLILVFMAYCMFAAGTTKIRNGGWTWLNGKALRFYIKESAEYARWPAFASALVTRRALCTLLSCFTVVIELAAILVLWKSSYRLPFVLAWTCLHMGILLVMMPAYWVQMWCYILVLDWGGITKLISGHKSEVIYPMASSLPLAAGPSAIFVSLLGFSICLALLVILVRQCECWPFTTVPMYSNAVSPDLERRPMLEELQLRAERAKAGDVSAWRRPWVTPEAWEDIWIIPRRDAQPISLHKLLEKRPNIKFVRWSQFAKVVREVTITDLIAKPKGRAEFDALAPEYPATRFLRQVEAVVKRALPEWNEYKRLEMVCHADPEWIVIGRIDL